MKSAFCRLHPIPNIQLQVCPIAYDFPLFVSSNLFEELKKTWPTNEKGYVQYKDVFEVSTWNHEGNVFIIDTVVCLSLDEIVKQKKEWGREKDLRDLELIELSKLNS